MNLKEAIRDVLGVREVHGTDEWPTYCFSPEHTNTNTPSASVNVAKGLWVCYSCGRGGSVRDLLAGTPISDPSVNDFLSDVDRDLQTLDGSGPTHFPDAFLRLFEQSVPHPAWAKRGINSRSVEHFRLGYDYETDSLTYPLRDEEGNVLGVVRRVLDDRKPKYRYPKGIDVHNLLFNYRNRPHGPAPYGKPLVLVEGALDAVAVHQAGDSLPHHPLGIYGSRLSQAQERLICRLNPSSVTLAFDNDEAGQDASRHILDETDLPLVTSVFQVDWRHFPDTKDIAELSEDERRFLLRHAPRVA